MEKIFMNKKCFFFDFTYCQKISGFYEGNVLYMFGK